MGKKYSQAMLATLVPVFLILGAYIVNAAPTITAKIYNKGQISASKVWAKSGTAEDIQAAVDAVSTAGGGIVYIPAGTFSFDANYQNGIGVIVPGGVSVIGMGKDVTVLECESYKGNIMFHCDGSNDKPIRISGITFKGHVYGTRDDNPDYYVNIGIAMWNCKKFRIDHCRFLDFPDAGVSASCYSSASKLENGEYQYYWNWGLIDHCDFDNPYKEKPGTWYWGYGIGAYGGGSGTASDAWLYSLSDIFGKWDIETNPIRCALYRWNATKNGYDLVDPYGGKYFRWLIYIENCTFKRCRHGISSNGGVFYVARHNYFEYNYPIGWPNVDAHGAIGNKGWWGGRGAEIYNNIINETVVAGGWGIDFRGGGGVVFNNTIISCNYGVSMRHEGDNTNKVCWVNDLWIWSNTYHDVTNELYNPCKYIEEVNYFLRKRPNYAPYPYPHPLTSQP